MGGELRQQLVEQRHPAVEPGLHLGEGEPGPDLDPLVVGSQDAQLLEPVEGDEQGWTQARD
jgi:hypothetical protein